MKDSIPPLHDDQTLTETRTALRRIGRISTALIGGRIAFAVVNLAAIAVATRAVGLEAIGAMGILLAFTRLIAEATKFDSWKAVLTFGAPFRQAGDRARLASLAGLTLCLDCAAIAVSLSFVALAGAMIGKWLGWSDDMTSVALWFMVATIFMTHMTPTGILRLEGRAIEVGIHHALNACCRLGGAAAISVWGGGFEQLALVWIGSAVIAGAVLWTLAAFSARRQFGRPDFSAPIQSGRTMPGFWSFSGVTNIVSTLNGAPGLISTLVVGAVLGPVEAGLFHIVRQIAEALQRPAEQLAHASFPEFARLAAAQMWDAMQSTLWRSTIIAFGCAVAVAVLLHFGGASLLSLLFGETASAGANVLTLAGCAAVLQAASFSIEPALLTSGRQRVVLWSQVAAFLVFAVILSLTIESTGLAGVGWSLVAFRLTQILIRLLVLRNGLRTDMS